MRSLVWMIMLLALACGCGGASYAKEPEVYAATAAEPAAEQAESDSGGLLSTLSPMAPPAPAERVARAGDEAKAAPGREAAPPPPAPPAPPVAVPDAPPAPRVPSLAGEKAGPLLIYRADFTMAVYEAEKSIDAVQKLATDLGGYLVKRDERSIIVRVPAEKYRGALEGVTKLGDVLHREESVEDVTEQFHDLMTRLRNARAMRDRLEQLLQKAKDVKEALAVERELGRITAEIESMEGKLKLLRELISFSTITVRFEARPSDSVRSNVRLPFSWLDRMGLPALMNLGESR